MKINTTQQQHSIRTCSLSCRLSQNLVYLFHGNLLWSNNISFNISFYFFNLEPILFTSIIPIHEPYSFPYIVLNTNATFETNLSIFSNTSAKFISPNRHAKKTSTTRVRFLHILQLFWQKRITVDV